MAAAVIAAIDQHVADAGFAHLAEGDLLQVGYGHGPITVLTLTDMRFSMKAYAPDHLVGRDHVHEMLGVITAEANVSKGIIATTSDFAPASVMIPALSPNTLRAILSDYVAAKFNLPEPKLIDLSPTSNHSERCLNTFRLRVLDAQMHELRPRL
jgi:hypothetical protein